MSDPKILETFPNPAPRRDYEIEHTHHEFTSLCPLTGHPDFATISVRYVADKQCVELKSLKLYFHRFRNQGVFFEAATNQICDDLGAALRPRSLTVVGTGRRGAGSRPGSRRSGGRRGGRSSPAGPAAPPRPDGAATARREGKVRRHRVTTALAARHQQEHLAPS